MKTVINAILILLVCLGCIAGGLAIGEKRWKGTSTKEYSALQEENQNLKKRLEHSNGAFDLCISDLVHEQDKIHWLEGKDTSGVSCSDLIAYQKLKYDQRIAEYDLHWKWEHSKIKKMDQLIDFTYKYFKQTQDSTAWKLLMDLRDPCDKKAGKQI